MNWGKKQTCCHHLLTEPAVCSLVYKSSKFQPLRLPVLCCECCLFSRVQQVPQGGGVSADC